MDSKMKKTRKKTKQLSGIALSLSLSEWSRRALQDNLRARYPRASSRKLQDHMYHHITQLEHIRQCSTATQRLASSLLRARHQYPICWHKGKGMWAAWPIGLPVTAVDTTKEKTRWRLYRAIQSHLECLIERGLPLPPPPRKLQGTHEVYAICFR